MPWIRVEQDYFDHPKTLHLKHLADDPTADIYPLRLWAWALKHAPEGDLSRFSPAVLKAAVQWKCPSKDFIAAMKETGFLEVAAGGGLMIHDWKEHTGRYEALTALGRTRVQRFRERRKQEESRGGNEAVTPLKCVPPAPEVEVEVEGKRTDLRSHDQALPLHPAGKPRRGAGTFQLNPLFDAFWKAYPRKEGKGAAIVAFSRALGNLNQGEREYLLKAMIEMVQLKARSEQWQTMSYIPHPATWLNQKRWLDTPPEAVNRKPGAPTYDSQTLGLAAWVQAVGSCVVAADQKLLAAEWNGSKPHAAAVKAVGGWPAIVTWDESHGFILRTTFIDAFVTAVKEAPDAGPRP